MNYVTWKFVPGRRSCHWAQSSGLQRALQAGQESPGLWGLLTAIGPAPEKPHQAVRFIFGSLTVIQQQLHIEWTYYVHFQSHNLFFCYMYMYFKWHTVKTTLYFKGSFSAKLPADTGDSDPGRKSRNSTEKWFNRVRKKCHRDLDEFSASVVLAMPADILFLVYNMNALYRVEISGPLEWTGMLLKPWGDDLCLEKNKTKQKTRNFVLFQACSGKKNNKKRQLWPKRSTAVRQQYFGTLCHTNDASIQGNIPHMTPPQAATADAE